WHPTIARALLENWGMPAHLAEAVESQDALREGDASELPLLSRLLASAKLYQLVVRNADGAEDARITLGNIRFGNAPFLAMIGNAQADIDAVRRVIGQ
ncbi:MAG: hypothetical protein Q8N51_02500, partial [Gammaproteobacteria bacterium]|nr:hypothetical protein [Gammaproteobacteria bacterium]